ncbi:28S ribosomal protein S7, mitochondrial [Cephus cinctus]|uniref:28S ribosomal protein S7, mitochondrial n=1 Tax=Cephus cinctus TaxID=211228 RepID=A0AAJ7BVJ8_CEPCN|nr:28S ribosomal protein S7, mitochondrial [Cephus cinctus]
MAIFRTLLRQVTFQKVLLGTKRSGVISLTNNYSLFPSTFIKGTFIPSEQNKLKESGELQKIAHIPIKPAFNDETSSEFYDPIVRKFTNYIMRKGKKVLARNLLEKTFENVKRIQLEKYNSSSFEAQTEIELNPTVILHQALANCKPVLELMPMRRGGVRYQVPVPIRESRSAFLAARWIIEAAKDKERTIHLPEKLAWELIEASKNQGRAVRRKQELHKQCEANRAYAHYRWS